MAALLQARPVRRLALRLPSRLYCRKRASFRALFRLPAAMYDAETIPRCAAARRRTTKLAASTLTRLALSTAWLGWIFPGPTPRDFEHGCAISMHAASIYSTRPDSEKCPHVIQTCNRSR